MGDVGRSVRFIGCCMAFLIYLYGVGMLPAVLPAFAYICFVVSVPVLEEAIKAAAFMTIGDDARWRIGYAVYFGLAEQIFRFLDRREVDVVAFAPMLFHVANALVFIELTKRTSAGNALAICIATHYAYNLTVGAIF